MKKVKLLVELREDHLLDCYVFSTETLSWHFWKKMSVKEYNQLQKEEKYKFELVWESGK